MRFLTVNAGSSSIRLATVQCEKAGQCASLVDEQTASDPGSPEECLRRYLGAHGTDRVDAVAHRVVHGGERLVRPCFLSAAAEREIERLAPLAPLHNPLALGWIRACRGVLGAEVPQIAVFDTAFFADMPEVARIYALPRDLCLGREVRRYGFHGLAHAAMWRSWRDLHGRQDCAGRVVSFQLGAGCSIAAIRDGYPIDTSMGFSTLEGLVMATRSGDVDPGLLLHLQRGCGITPERLEVLLSEESGLRGVSGISGDMRVLLAASEPAARMAVELYCYRARKYLGAFIAILGGVDAILFGGGVGENSPEIRARILAAMTWAGIELDSARNHSAKGVATALHAEDSKTEIHVLPVDEARILAEEAFGMMMTISGRARNPAVSGDEYA